ncbi:BolA family protein [Amphibiibacter pelophylacis]|uniref:BolA/IbaG family iron-sulfur metabolism protein n=1 Tax=Amphibiibacter pelophylacis TaxID=1799477 RepID=A0ACC6NYV5_9BURK
MTASPTSLPTDFPTAAQIDAILRQALQPTRLTVLDDSAAHAGHAGANGTGAGTHFRVQIAAPGLDALPRVARHRRIYAALEAAGCSGWHALAIEVLPG